jgi:hypothetical protein
MKATPDRPEWRARGARMRQMSAELAEFATHFNLERESCTCGESHRWKDMVQWQLNERFLGVIEKLNNLADTIERRAHEFDAKDEATP